MKIIDLLNKIANGEEVPKKIHYNCVPLYWCEPCKIYETMTDSGLHGKDLYTLLDNLNDEIEIIEETKKIPEKLNNGYKKEAIEDMKEARFNSNDMAKICNRIGWLMENRNDLSNKIDEIIDYLNSKGE